MPPPYSSYDKINAVAKYIKYASHKLGFWGKNYGFDQFAGYFIKFQRAAYF